MFDGAVVMAKSLPEFNLVYLMNEEQRQTATHPQSQ